MLAGTGVLIVEDEILIALDLERIISDAGGRAVLARNFGEATQLRERWPEFALAIVNPPTGDQIDIAIARDLGAGMAMVICSAISNYDSRSDGLGGWPTLAKPFTEEQLLAACATALAGQTSR